MIHSASETQQVLPQAGMHRNISLLLLSLLLFLLVIAPLPAVEPPSVERAGSKSAPADKLIIGEIEYVAIAAVNSVFEARIDTGAKTSAIYAVDIETFERDGKPWARFTIKNPRQDKEFPLEMEVARTSRVKQEGRESERRMGVILYLTLGEITKRLTVSLADRSGFDYPLLIGRDFLSGSAVVDVTRKFTQKTPGAPNINKKRNK